MQREETIALDAETGGRITGELAMDEDAPALAHALERCRADLLEGRLPLLLHAPCDSPAYAPEAATKLERLARGRLARYVFALETAAGTRIVKVAEVTRAGNALLGLVGGSVARREHRDHARADALGLAATRSQGYLEWRRGARLLRSCQVQAPLDANALGLGALLAEELATYGFDALAPLAEALAAVHARRFFHADLKPFHAFAQGLCRRGAEPARYELSFIDLGRVGFHLSERQRVINLYQALRFIVPGHPRAHRTFVAAYAHAAGWHAGAPERALAIVHRFLAHKYLTHPVA